MSDPMTPTDAPDADVPSPEETGLGAWMPVDRPEEPVDEPEPS